MLSSNDAFGRSPVLQHRAQLQKLFEVMRHQVFSCRLALARHREQRSLGLLLQVQFSGPTTASQSPGQRVLWCLLHCLMHLLALDLRLLHLSRIEKCGRKSTRRLLLTCEGKRGIFWRSGSLEKDKDAAGCRCLASAMNTISCRSEPYRNLLPGSVRDKAMESAGSSPVGAPKSTHLQVGEVISRILLTLDDKVNRLNNCHAERVNELTSMAGSWDSWQKARTQLFFGVLDQSTVLEASCLFAILIQGSAW